MPDPGFKFRLYYLLALCPCTNYLTSLCVLLKKKKKDDNNIAHLTGKVNIIYPLNPGTFASKRGRVLLIILLG